jgi:subtilisin family serine protease
MKILSYSLALLILLSIHSFGFAKDGESATLSVIQTVPGEIVIKFKSDPQMLVGSKQTSFTLVNQNLEKLEVNGIEYAFPYLRNSEKVGASDLSNIVFVQFNPIYSVTSVLQSLNADPNVVYAEQKRMFFVDEVPNDPNYNSMSQFDRISAEAAWDLVKGENGTVVIAIVDSGVDWVHPDLIDNIWNNEDEIPDNGIDDDNNGYIDDVRGWSFQNNSNDPTPLLNGHGTHVSGTAAASTDNNTGVASLSWNCTIMPVNAGSATSANSIAFGYPGIVYAVENDADIINCSWGGVGNPSVFEQDIIDFAVENGTLVVAAAGNDNLNNDLPGNAHYPSSYNGVLNVGSTSSTSDTKSGFSTYGSTVNVFAPGGNILSTTWPGNSYGFSSGTSMASPLVSALAGLVKTQNPGWSPDKVREQIRVTCDNIDGSNSSSLNGLLGKGRINAERALSEFDIPALQIVDVTSVEAPDGGNGDDVVDAGETIDVTVTFKNYLADATGVNVTLSVDDSNIDLIEDQGSIGTINGDETGSVTFRFTTDDGLADGYILRFFTEITADNGYEDMDNFNLSITPVQFITHNTGDLLVSVTNTGNIGAAGFIGSSPGDGFVYNGDQYLFEGGLLVGVSSSQISNTLRVAGQTEQDQDFSIAEDGFLTIVEPGADFDQESSVLYTDENAVNPLNIFVEQNGLSTLDPDSNDYIILTYEVRNENAFVLENVHIGLFFDWDISATAEDYGRHDADRRLGITQNTATNPTKIVAVKLLTPIGDYHHRTVHNPDEVYNDFSDAEKFQFISSGIQTESLDNIDVANMTGVGPFDLEPNQTVSVAFAIIGANSMDDLEASADQVQALWDGVTGIEEIGINPVSFNLNLYPNPVSDQLTVSFSLEQNRKIGLNVLNINGQVIISESEKVFQVGAQEIKTDLSNLPSGNYLLQLVIDGQTVNKYIIIE